MCKPTLAILITGDPIPTVRQLVPRFGALIFEIAGAANVAWELVDLRTPEQLPDPRAFAACIITGSPHSVLDQTPWIRRAEAYLRSARGLGVGLFGICFGHQLMASAFGGRVTINSHGHEMGLYVAKSLASNSDLPWSTDSIEVLMSHRDTVSMLPPSARALAQTCRDAHAAIDYGDFCFSTQFHPEFTPAVLKCYLEHHRQQLQAQGDDVDRLMAHIRETPKARAVLRRFIDAAITRNRQRICRCAN